MLLTFAKVAEEANKVQTEPSARHISRNLRHIVTVTLNWIGVMQFKNAPYLLVSHSLIHTAPQFAFFGPRFERGVSDQIAQLAITSISRVDDLKDKTLHFARVLDLGWPKAIKAITQRSSGNQNTSSEARTRFAPGSE